MCFSRKHFSDRNQSTSNRQLAHDNLNRNSRHCNIFSIGRNRNPNTNLGFFNSIPQSLQQLNSKRGICWKSQIWISQNDIMREKITQGNSKINRALRLFWAGDGMWLQRYSNLHKRKSNKGYPSMHPLPTTHGPCSPK